MMLKGTFVFIRTPPKIVLCRHAMGTGKICQHTLAVYYFITRLAFCQELKHVFEIERAIDIDGAGNVEGAHDDQIVEFVD